MYARPSAPRTIGGVLDDALSLYRHSFAGIWPVSLAAAVIVSLPGLSLAMKLGRARTGGQQAVLELMQSSGYWITYLALALIYMVLYGALICALDDFVERGRTSVGEALATTINLLPRLLGASIVLWIVIMVASILFIIPGIYVSGIFMLTLVALVVERARVTESFGISRRLIKGYWWRSMTIVTIAFIIIMVFGIVGGLVNGLLSGVLSLGFSESLLDQALVGAVLDIFLLPLLPCFLLTMYFDLKLRHEGGDLAARIDALGAR
jgi:hypothetical protein